LWPNYYIVLHRDGNFILSVNIHAPFLQVEVQENFEKSKKDLNGKITDKSNTQLVFWMEYKCVVVY
jgi:hypothetical protein